MITPNGTPPWDDLSVKIKEMAQQYMNHSSPAKESPITMATTDLFHNDLPSYSPTVSNAYNTSSELDLQKIRNDFPILSKKVNGKNLVWFDNGATTQKPFKVIDRIRYFYENENSNVHRGAHALAEKATQAYEYARKTVADFIHAPSPDNIIFVRGTTEAINLVAASYGDTFLRKGDEIIISHMEHHANIVPWQLLCQRSGALLKIIPVDDSGQLMLDAYGALLSDKTKIVALTQVSNVLGTVTPIKEIVQMAHSHGAKVLVDGAQSVAHLQTDVTETDVDFFVFSGHKIFAPTGIGVLYGKQELLNSMTPYQSGGNMIADVTFEKTLYHEAPIRFEAGTGNIADAVALGAALEYVSSIGIKKISSYEHKLLNYGTKALKEIENLRILGNAKNKAAVLSFVIDGVSNQKVSDALKKEGIAVRVGHHCAQPIHRRFGVEQSIRAAMAFYNTKEEIDLMVNSLRKLIM